MKHVVSRINIIDFIKDLDKGFNKKSNKKISNSQKAYMRNQFDFFGLKADERRKIQAPIFKKYKLSKTSNFKKLIISLWKKKQRDYQYCAQELTLKHIEEVEIKDIDLFEFMIVNNPWWDTIDFIAPKILGKYFQLYPRQIEIKIQEWILSNNIWLQRSCLLFQLKYKKNMDTKLLSHIIYSLSDSKEFFINKAIGWILREYGKTDNRWVIDFVHKTKLNNLSKQQALKLINR